MKVDIGCQRELSKGKALRMTAVTAKYRKLSVAGGHNPQIFVYHKWSARNCGWCKWQLRCWACRWQGEAGAQIITPNSFWHEDYIMPGIFPGHVAPICHVVWSTMSSLNYPLSAHSINTFEISSRQKTVDQGPGRWPLFSRACSLVDDLTNSEESLVGYFTKGSSIMTCFF